MLTYFIKFVHLLIVLGLLGSAISCLALVGSRKFVASSFNQPDIIARLNMLMLVLILFAMLTGTLLVYPRHFTFHTPWIQAAYVLVLSFSLVMWGLLRLQRKKLPRWIGWVIYLFLVMLLIGVVHDAVTKTTFLPYF